MPLYDCMLLLKPHVSKTGLLDLVSRLGKHVYARNGVVTELRPFGKVQLGYGIKKLDGRYYEMTMMATPNINKEFHYLNKEDRLLRCLVVKNRGVKFDNEYMSEEELSSPRSSVDDDEDVDDYVGDLDDDEYEVENRE